MAERQDPCVLLSGGVDSAVVARLLVEGGTRPVALFIDYGQPAATAERSASESLSYQFRLSWRAVEVAGLRIPQSGEIPGRNDLLLACGFAAEPGRDLAIGVHDGTGYTDCSPAHRDAWQAVIDVQHGGASQVLAPLAKLSKSEVFSLASALEIPLALTYSCEAANEPCGSCSSCLDRRRQANDSRT